MITLSFYNITKQVSQPENFRGVNYQHQKWGDVRIWQDANGDAQTDADELKTLRFGLC